MIEQSETAASSVTSRVCPECRQTFGGDAGFCPHDGTPLIDHSVTFSSIHDDEADTPPPPGGQEVEVVAGMLIGDYRVERLVGEGGMGQIFSAVHPVIRKRVAVKVLNRRYAQDPRSISRFVLEARSVNEIGHHNIVDIFSIGELDDGRNYFIMEYLEGRALDEILDRTGRLSPGQVLPVFEQLCDALHAAHSKGFVHRDLKPANIIVLTRPPYPFIKILDFGLAKLRGSTSSTLTKVGTVLGTPEYMAPEQCRGASVDERSDIYALGILLYELVTGTRPFDASSALQILTMQQSQAPTPPSKLQRIPARLEQVILKALSKKPEGRHGSALELLSELQAAIPTPSPWSVDLEAPPRPRSDTEAGEPCNDARSGTETTLWVGPVIEPADPPEDPGAKTIPMETLDPDSRDEMVASGLATTPMTAVRDSVPESIDATKPPATAASETRRPQPSPGPTRPPWPPPPELDETQPMPAPAPMEQPPDSSPPTQPVPPLTPARPDASQDRDNAGSPSPGPNTAAGSHHADHRESEGASPNPPTSGQPPADPVSGKTQPLDPEEMPRVSAESKKEMREMARRVLGKIPGRSHGYEADVSTSLLSPKRADTRSVFPPSMQLHRGKHIVFWVLLTLFAVLSGMGIAFLISTIADR